MQKFPPGSLCTLVYFWLISERSSDLWLSSSRIWNHSMFVFRENHAGSGGSASIRITASTASILTMQDFPRKLNCPWSKKSAKHKSPWKKYVKLHKPNFRIKYQLLKMQNPFSQAPLSNHDLVSSVAFWSLKSEICVSANICFLEHGFLHSWLVRRRNF